MTDHRREDHNVSLRWTRHESALDESLPRSVLDPSSWLKSAGTVTVAKGQIRTVRALALDLEKVSRFLLREAEESENFEMNSLCELAERLRLHASVIGAATDGIDTSTKVPR